MLIFNIILPSIGALIFITYQGFTYNVVIRFDASTSDYQFTQTYIKGLVSFTNLSIGIDGISLYFVLLDTFLIPICLVSN